MIQIVLIAVLAIIVVGLVVFLCKADTSGSNGSSSGSGNPREEHKKSDVHEKTNDDQDHDQDRMDE